jgi:hypothetical protein
MIILYVDRQLPRLAPYNLFSEDVNMNTVVKTDISLSLAGVEEVQIFFNFRHDHELYLPEDIRLEDSPESKRKGPPTGELVGMGTWVDTRFLDVNFKSNGFRLKNLALRDRKNGLRAVATWVPGIHTVETWDEMCRRIDIESGFQILQGHFWDLRIYRNPGENGGNVCIECGNPRETLWFAGSYGIRVYEGRLELRKGYW